MLCMKLTAKIYRPAKSAMSSGRAKTHLWTLEYKPLIKNTPEPLMGWNSGGTLQQIKLQFDTQEEAIAYAKDKGIAYELQAPKERIYKPKAYASNFATNRRMSF
jgi:hypothetical protein